MHLTLVLFLVYRQQCCTISTEHTGERAVAGVTAGLIELGETVTWRAKHLGVWQHLTSKITEYGRPYFFVDEMVSGAFKQFRHEHHFKQVDDATLMLDVFDYTSPLGMLGTLADKVFLKKYMTHLLTERDSVIKQYAESGQWRNVVKIDRIVRG
ncbi:SRPBCC family protein [Pontibacter pamirensis]|uniref:SRPBCC family protein n=1 Tax=Pontibacter pamirensis TaxID=2562824 RepID=UPI001F35251C|nr:SRPBCC family protein [Pontibacter pamirensis]